VFSVLAPLVDVALFWRLAMSSYDFWQHPAQFDGDTLQKVCLYYLVFLVVDLASAAIALAMEKIEKWSLVRWLMLQRFGYRQLMYDIVVKAVLTAALGPLVGWGKLDRKATVPS
jgi:peptidoglycan-N-acetylglucosamine deacetylase